MFAELTDLEELELQGETITDAAIDYLVGLPTLHQLSLENTRITDEEWRTCSVCEASGP